MRPANWARMTPWPCQVTWMMSTCTFCRIWGRQYAEGCQGRQSAEWCQGRQSAEWCHCRSQGRQSAEWCHCRSQGRQSVEWCHCRSQGRQSAELGHCRNQGRQSAEWCHCRSQGRQYTEWSQYKVSWLLHYRWDQEEGGELDSQEEAGPEEIKSREVVLGYKVGFLLFPIGRATDMSLWLFCIAVGTAIAWCCGRCAMPDGHCLNILLFWRQSTAALVFRVGVCFKVSLFCPPFPLIPVPNRPSRLRGR